MNSLAKFDEELQSLQLDKPVAGKTAYQLQKHTVDEQYDSKPIERSLFILTKGDDIQKLSVIQALPDLLQTDNNATISRIIPKIQQELPSSSSEFHLVTSKIFKVLIEMKLNLNLMRPVLQGIESKDPIVSNAWIETLLAVIPSLSDGVLKNDVLPFAIRISQINKSVFYRVNSCKILGQIAIHPKTTPYDVKKDILPLTQSLCQDCLYEVRAAMCAELPNVASGLANDIIVKTSLLPCLVELSSDENMQVRSASVDAVALLIPFMNPDTIKMTAVPLVKRLCSQSSKEGDQTFPAVAKIFGKLLNNLQPHLTPADNAWFLNYFKELSRKGLSISNEDLEIDPALAVTCRDYCAYNLPAITFFTLYQLQPELDKWYSIFKDLAGDSCYIVRKTVAGCIHEITKVLGKECKIIVPDIVRLFRDDAEEVLEVLVPNIGPTLQLLCSAGILTRENNTQYTLDIGRALLKCQTEIFKYYNWRRKMGFLEQLECLPTVVPADFIHQHFTPMVLKLTVEARSRPVRTQAAKTMLVFLRYSIKENHRKWIRENLINLLCNSPSCYTRHIYINMCVHAIDLFSWKYFKEHFYLPLLTLGDDPVSTVRLCVLNLCPVLKQMLVLPLDRNLQLRLEGFMSKIEVMEKDKDVIDTLKAKLKEMRSSQVSKQEALIEERRKIEEEEKIAQGKISTNALISYKSAITPFLVRESSRRNNAITSRTISSAKKPVSSAGSSKMSFLGQHFYIDAGVALPKNINSIEGKMSRLTITAEEDIVSTVSVENLTDEVLIQLETSTNITDDVKANIQKLGTSVSTLRSKQPVEAVKKRNKRNSCVFTGDNARTNKTLLKRRSLNIGPSEISKIPVCSRSIRKAEDETNMKRSKSGSIQSVCSKIGDKSSPSRLKVPLKADNNGTSKSGTKLGPFKSGGVMSNKLCQIAKREVKENIPMPNSSIKSNVPIKLNEETNSAKVSSLPVLVRPGSGVK
ncbi:unnamed protein product [Phaedon cochleariae]|uniref:Serine/threonine-protein phosphatase 4 regulatory subunit 4 n=1 Tax=Phaedon cochleariae TaxID=80249 RepID=A0A9P0DBU9_PHACE|nr:unnamed protein product [Phaedon cochleariae]